VNQSEIKFPDANSYPRWLVPVALTFGLPTFFLFAYFEAAARGFAAALSIGSIIIVLVTCRNLRTYISFWLVMAVCVLFHVEAVRAVPADADTHFPGIIFTPLFIADFLFWQFASVSTVRFLRH
jgi:hypothetical protein